MQIGFIRVEAVKAGPGFAKHYIRSINFVGKADTVCFLDPNDYLVLAYALLLEPVNFTKPGEVKEVIVPLVLVETLSVEVALILGLPPSQPMAYLASPLAEALSRPVLIGLGTSSVTAVLQEPVNLRSYIESAQMIIGLLAGRTRGCNPNDLTTNRVVDENRIHYIRVNLTTGDYEMIYIDGSTSRTVKGRARAFMNTNLFDLGDLSWEER